MNSSNSIYSIAPRVPRFNANLNRVFRGSVPPCVGIPVYEKTTIPDSKFSISYRHMLQTLPLTSPVFADGSITFSWYWLSWYSCIPGIRDSVYRAKLHSVKIPRMYIPWTSIDANDLINIQDSSKVYSESSIAAFSDLTDYKEHSVLSGSLCTYFGIPQGFIPFGTDSVALGGPWFLYLKGQTTPSIPYFMYYSIFYHHRANLQDPNFYVLMRADNDPTGRTTPTQFGIGALQKYLSYAATYDLTSNPGALSGYDALAMFGRSSQDHALFGAAEGGTFLGKNCGLWCCPSRPDYFTSYVSAVNYTSITNAGSVVISEGLFTVDSLILAQALRRYNAYESYGNGTFLDMIYSLYEAKPQANGMIPIFLGRDSANLNFQSIFATSSDGLGDLGGRGSSASQFRSRRFRFDNYGTLMCVAEIRPYLSYFQGRYDGDFQYLSDIPSPTLDTNDLVPTPLSAYNGLSFWFTGSSDGKSMANIGIPGIIAESASTAINDVPGRDPYSTIANYRPRFSEWKTDFDRIYGDLCGSLSNWTFSRPFGPNIFDPQDSTVNSTSASAYYKPGGFSYLYPYLMNRVFTDVSDESQNFILSIDFQIKAKLPLYRPNFAEL